MSKWLECKKTGEEVETEIDSAESMEYVRGEDSEMAADSIVWAREGVTEWLG